MQGQSKYGLTNTGWFKRMNCKGDSKFHKCLSKQHNAVADAIGYTYFTILRPQCFKKGYKISECYFWFK